MKEPFVQKTFNSLSAVTVNKDVMEWVASLVKEGYIVEVTLHKPVTHVYSDGATYVEYMTTVQGIAYGFKDLIKLKS